MSILEDNAAVRVLREQGIKQGIKQGMEQGIKQGNKQGIEKEKKETATLMLQKGFDKSIISEIIKKPVSWIEELTLNME